MRARKADEVLDAARRVFLERGYDAATVEQVASEAGVSKATVYSNFRDKDALLAAMIDRVIPSEFFRPVAEIIYFLHARKKKVDA